MPSIRADEVYNRVGGPIARSLVLARRVPYILRIKLSMKTEGSERDEMAVKIKRVVVAESTPGWA